MRKLQRSNLFLDKETLHLHRLRRMGYKESLSNNFVSYYIKAKSTVLFTPISMHSDKHIITVLSEKGFEEYILYDGTFIDYLDKVFNYLDKL